MAETKLNIKQRNSLIVLTVNDEKELWELAKEAEYSFREEDFCDEITAVVFIDNNKLKNLPLAGKKQGKLRRETQLRLLSRSMMSCEQTEGQSVLEHGIAVRNKFRELWGHLRYDTQLDDTWRIPEWLEDNKDWFLQVEPDLFEIEKYLIVYDCGKPYVEQSEGQRFPDYAKMSRRVWSAFEDNEKILDLIERDSMLHTGRSEEAKQILEDGYAPHLLLAALSELHTNAEIFGGIESKSFVVKYKNLGRRAKTILNNK